ncbi:MAG: hypothetical protein GWN01_17875, partial [Nitrosopumilaceae archaeon]|nr:hypothetical protein [Nitrosopumilaceae archaeon]NIX63291.1 hypothetical protein [Nitrosopumilaceae archaeon]
MRLIAEALDLDLYWLITGKSIRDKKSEELISGYKITDKKAARIAEEKSKYHIKLPNGEII